MLTNEMKNRLRRAGEYQKKAILELLPEGAEKHLNVIAGEMKEMVAETVAYVAKECCKGFAAAGSSNVGTEKAGTEGEGKKREGARKVTIE